jgi:hypothetical protein
MKISALGLCPVNKTNQNYNAKTNNQPAFKGYINITTREPLHPNDIHNFCEILMAYLPERASVIKSSIGLDDHAKISVHVNEKLHQAAQETVEKLKKIPETNILTLDVAFDEAKSCIPD